jgi:hypothetical protein
VGDHLVNPVDSPPELVVSVERCFVSPETSPNRIVATVARRWRRNVLANLVAILPRSGERSYVSQQRRTRSLVTHDLSQLFQTTMQQPANRRNTAIQMFGNIGQFPPLQVVKYHRVALVSR